MTQSADIVLRLIRKAINSESDVHIPKDTNWTSVIDFATQQGVLGLCFQTIELLSPDQRPDMDNLMDWLGQVEYMKSCYEEHRKNIADLASFYKTYEIKMMLLKGYGVSLYWPTPEHRPVGDIDIYLGHLWEYADQMVHDKLGIEVDDGHEHHTTFSYKGVMVENHYDFVNTKENESSRELEVVYKKLAEETFNLKLSETNAEGLKPTETNIFFPSPTLNAIFLIRHLGQHFAGAEATLRQVLDWGFFMTHESSKVDWAMVVPVLKKAGIYELFFHINAICVDFLGFKFQMVSEFQVVSEVVDKSLERRILGDILSPEFVDSKPNGSTLQVIWFKTRRFFANRWKRKLVYREGICSQLYYGSIAHLKRFNTIKD